MNQNKESQIFFCSISNSAITNKLSFTLQRVKQLKLQFMFKTIKDNEIILKSV